MEKLRKYETKGQEWVLDNLIFLARTGSYLYGTNVEDSDTDYVGVTYAPTSYWLGNDTFEVKDKDKDQDQIDYTIYDFRKFVSLASKSNPNILEIVWIPPDSPHCLKMDHIWRESIYANRWKFHTQRTYHAFSKFAESQIRKLTNIQSNKPSRAAIKEKYGWDTKFAMHTLRLLHEATDLMEGRDIVYPRPKQEYYRGIREGRVWGKDEFDRCVEYLQQVSRDFETDYALISNELPNSCNRQFVNDLLVRFFYQMVHNEWDLEEACDRLDEVRNTVGVGS